jgi:hypothetical protein
VRAQRNRLAPMLIPAPEGINRTDAVMAMPPSDCIDLYNAVRDEMGLRTRLGYEEHVTGLGSAVRSVLAFAGSDATKDKLFACCEDGIYDCTTSTATPTRVYEFATKNTTSGRGNASVYVSAAGHFLVYCDETNGYIRFDEDTTTWAAVAAGAGAGQINGTYTGGGAVDPADFAFVCPWKNRLWFVERDSARAWYADVGVHSGDVAQFDFGNRFPHGGTLVGLWSCTLDGGAGVDDYLVAVSSAGDVVVYQGTDPSSAASFALKGSWFIGSTPAGRRIATDVGGDLLLMSLLGAIPLSRLISGQVVAAAGTYETYKIAPIFRRLAQEKRNETGWEVKLHPGDGTLLINVPSTEGGDQLAMGLSRKSWGRYRDLPVACMETWGGKLYFGTSDGRLCINDGWLDNTLRDGTPGSAIEAAVLTSFQTGGFAGVKRVQFIRPRFLSEGAVVGFKAKAAFDFDFSEVSGSPAPGTAVDSWDSGLWDAAVWGSGGYTPSSSVVGATGIGTHLAIALKWVASARSILAGIEVHGDRGGIL